MIVQPVIPRLYLCAHRPAKLNPVILGQVEHPRVSPPISLARGPFEIAVGRDKAAAILEPLSEHARGVDRLDSGCNRSHLSNLLGEELHQTPAARNHLLVAALVEHHEVDGLHRRDVKARLQVRRWLVVDAVKRVDLRPGHLMGEATSHCSVELAVLAIGPSIKTARGKRCVHSFRPEDAPAPLFNFDMFKHCRICENRTKDSVL